MGILHIERDLDYGFVTVSLNEVPTFDWPDGGGDETDLWKTDFVDTQKLSVVNTTYLGSQNTFALKTYQVNNIEDIKVYCGSEKVNFGGGKYITPAIYEQGTVLHYYACLNNIVIDYQPVMIDFQDILISDSYTTGNPKTLRIAYNPTFSAIKTTFMENKVETLESQFPFFFRNGKVKYKEFNIGGLLSGTNIKDLRIFDTNLANEYENHFKKPTLRGMTADAGYSDLFDEAASEVYFERKFKRKVEEWLTDGQPKLVRTATEGNFWVRFMNVNLTPMEQLGRKLHSFEATAYEVGSLESINSNGYFPGFSKGNYTLAERTMPETEINDSELFPQAPWKFEQARLPNYISIRTFNFKNNDSENDKTFLYNGQSQTILANGTLSFNAGRENEAYSQRNSTLIVNFGQTDVKLSVLYAYYQYNIETETGGGE